MISSKKMISFLISIFIVVFSTIALAENTTNIPILCYHNFNPTVPGIMNLTPKKFESQIQWIQENGYTIVPLKEVVEYLKGNRASLPDKAVVITIDDGWQSVYHYILPIVKKYKIPVTLFIYPETISVGKNALTWDELKTLQETGFFDIEGHTYTHPNFKLEKRHLSEMAFEREVKMELEKSKKILEEKLGTQITLLAWPFGIYDPYLEQQAKNAGYEMSFSIDARPANKSYPSMAEPRYMILDKQSMKTFTSIINTARH